MGAAKLQRAVELGDGWAPQGANHLTFAEMVKRAIQSPAFAARERPLEIIMATPPELDPVQEPRRLADAIAELDTIGATMLNVRLVHRSLAHCLEQFEAYAEVAKGTGLVQFAAP